MRSYDPSGSNLPLTSTRFGRTRLGPITITRTAESTIATDADGTRIDIAGPFLESKSELLHRLALGVDVVTNGCITGRLTQPRHGTWQHQRTIELTNVEGHRYPEGAHFRARGLSGDLSLETPDKALITTRRPRVLNLVGLLRIEPSVSSELLALYGAVAASVGTGTHF